jgi:hypothetical protein
MKIETSKDIAAIRAELLSIRKCLIESGFKYTALHIGIAVFEMEHEVETTTLSLAPNVPQGLEYAEGLGTQQLQ